MGDEDVNGNPFEHIMIDIETMSTAPDAAIMSIGAVAFDPNTGVQGPEFHERINFGEAVNNGRTDLDTIKWWISQDAEAGKLVTSGEKPYKEAMADFSNYIQSFGSPYVWGNGSVFDITILGNAMTRLEMDIPWKFYNIRDCRTIEACAQGIDERNNYERKGTHHDALDDAKYQAAYISGMWRNLRAAKIMQDSAEAAA